MSPAPTGYLCESCTRLVSEAAKNLAAQIDALALEAVMRELDGSDAA
jgi:hypothetical protein